MPRPVKFTNPRATLNAKIDAEVLEAVRELSDESGIPQNALVEDALCLLLRAHGRDTGTGWLDRCGASDVDTLPPEQAVAVAAFADGVPADRQCGNCGTALFKQARKCSMCGTLNPNFRGAK